MDDKETVADIAAEKRRIAKEVRDHASNGDYWDKKKVNETAEDLEEEADRIDAAWKRDTKELRVEIERLKEERNYSGVRERERLRAKGFAIVPKEQLELGDAAKLREALERIVNERGILDFCHNNLGSKTWEDWDKVYKTLRKWIGEAMSALAAPPRNCDRFATIDEARKAHEEYRRDYIMRASNKFDFPMEFEVWLLATATEKEGGAK